MCVELLRYKCNAHVEFLADNHRTYSNIFTNVELLRQRWIVWKMTPTGSESPSQVYISLLYHCATLSSWFFIAESHDTLPGLMKMRASSCSIAEWKKTTYVQDKKISTVLLYFSYVREVFLEGTSKSSTAFFTVCVCERFMYSHDRSTYFLQQK